MNRRKPARFKTKTKWEFTNTNWCLIITSYVVIILVILSARAKYNRQLEDYQRKASAPKPTQAPTKLPVCNEKYRHKFGVDHCAEIPNKMFVFHNKIPKSGSTTFYNIVSALTKQNDFDLVHMHPCFDEKDPQKIQDDLYYKNFRPNYDYHNCDHGIARNAELSEWIESFRDPNRKMFFIKHHVFTNFTQEFGTIQPTYINVARDPVNLFASKFFYARYSCNGCGKSTRNHAREIESIEKCIKEAEPECAGDTVHQVLLEYLCGTGDDCNRHKDLPKMVAKVKHNVMQGYFFIGLLEEMELSLKFLELKMPQFLSGILDVYKGPIGQQTTYTSSTAYNYTISEEVRKYLSTGPLKYSADIYNFIESVFWQKLRANGLQQ